MSVRVGPDPGVPDAVLSRFRKRESGFPDVWRAPVILGIASSNRPVTGLSGGHEFRFGDGPGENHVADRFDGRAHRPETALRAG